MGFFVIVPIVITLIIVGAIYSHRKEKERQQEMRLFADQNGWYFTAERDRQHHKKFSQFKIFSRGHSRFAHNIIHGSLKIDDRDWPFQAGDYHYQITTNNGKSSSTKTYRFSYLLVEIPFQQVPDLFIRKEGFFDKVSATMGWDDIDFESKEFSDRFHVTSSDKRFAYDVIDPRMMRFLMSSEPPKIDLSQGYCCLSAGSKRWKPEEFQRMIGWASAFYDHWPNHLTASLESRSHN